MKNGEVLTEDFLRKKATSNKLFDEMVRLNLIEYVDTTDIGVKRYIITEKGIKERNR